MTHVSLYSINYCIVYVEIPSLYEGVASIRHHNSKSWGHIVVRVYLHDVTLTGTDQGTDVTLNFDIYMESQTNRLYIESLTDRLWMLIHTVSTRFDVHCSIVIIPIPVIMGPTMKVF